MRCHLSSGQLSGLLFQKTMDARHDSEIKLTTGSRRISASHAETKQGYSASGKPHAQTVGGLNAETRIGGIEPMGKISLLTFLFIGLPGCGQTGIAVLISQAEYALPLY
jgi:hypothetical protein